MIAIRLLILAALLVVIQAVGCKQKTPATGGSTNRGNSIQESPEAPPLPDPAKSAMAPSDQEALQAMNDAVGVMGMFRYNDAAAAFGDLVRQYPQWVDAQVNLAIAILNRQEEGDEAAAMERLNAVIATDGTHLRARYTAAILLRRAGQSDKARQHLQYVVEQDPDDAYALYYLGQEIARDDADAAIAMFEQAIAADPYLRSPYYAAFQVLMRQGETERAMEFQASFDRLLNNPLASVIREVYTRMGPKAEARTGAEGSAKPPDLPSPDAITLGPRDTLVDSEAGVEWRMPSGDRPVSITSADIDEDGDIDVFVAGVISAPNGAVNAVIMNEGSGAFQLDLEHALAHVLDVNAAAWGDFDNDELIDVYLLRSGSNLLWRQSARGRWDDVTDSTGTSGGDFDTVDGVFADADHDGDLDLFCVNRDGPNVLLNNNLDGTFTDIAEAQGIAGNGRASRQVLFTDLDLDRDADIVVINETAPHEVYFNDRLWNYRAADGFDAFTQSEIDALVQGDLNADGFPDLHARAPDGTVTTWTRDSDESWTPRTNQSLIGKGNAGGGLAVADVHGHGTLSLIAGPPTREAAFSGWSIVQFGHGRGPSVVAVSAQDGVNVWFGGRGYVTIELRGMEDGSSGPPPARTNRSGIGSKLAARNGARWTVVETHRDSSGPGQSVQPIAIGLGGAGNIDYLSIDWPDGVFQSEVHGESPIGDAPVRDLSIGGHVIIGELQRIKSSCPVLFAWNGNKYVFVSDLLGVGGIGYMVAPGEYGEPRPWENFLIPAGLLQPLNGKYMLKIGEPMEEACYLDAVSLTAYDLPPGWSMTIDERMSILGPEPTGEPRFYRHSVSPVRAVNERGEDVTTAIRVADLHAAPVGDLDARFLGRLTSEHVLTVEFDQPIDASARQGDPMLIIDGWVEYPYSQTMFAAWQAGATFDAPTIEARDAGGNWRIVLEQFGYPAGMPRQMSVPLAGLPAGCTSIRVRTNQEIYWDCIRIAWSEPCPDAVVESLPPVEATLRRSGFAVRSTGPQRQPHYDYDNRPSLGDSRYMSGRYTQFGAISDLLNDADNVLAIFGPGEEAQLEFAAVEKPPTAGWTRRLVVKTTGWCKDMDLFTDTGQAVGPIPGLRTTELLIEAQEARRTRVESGR